MLNLGSETHYDYLKDRDMDDHIKGRFSLIVGMDKDLTGSRMIVLSGKSGKAFHKAMLLVLKSLGR